MTERAGKARPITHPADPVIERLISMVGYVPLGTRDLLACLAHPDVIDLTRQFLEEMEARDDQ